MTAPRVSPPVSEKAAWLGIRWGVERADGLREKKRSNGRKRGMMG